MQKLFTVIALLASILTAGLGSAQAANFFDGSVGGTWIEEVRQDQSDHWHKLIELDGAPTRVDIVKNENGVTLFMLARQCTDVDHVVFSTLNTRNMRVAGEDCAGVVATQATFAIAFHATGDLPKGITNPLN